LLQKAVNVNKSAALFQSAAKNHDKSNLDISNLDGANPSSVMNSMISQGLNSYREDASNMYGLNPAREDINYAEGIRIMRLNPEGRVVEIFESDEEGFSSDEDEDMALNKGRNGGKK
jgi:hypothetical protein